MKKAKRFVSFVLMLIMTLVILGSATVIIFFSATSKTANVKIIRSIADQPERLVR